MMEKLLLTLLMIVASWPVQARAGFEFSGARSLMPSDSASPQAYPVLPLDEPLPIVSSPSVTAMPLDSAGVKQSSVLTPLMPSEKEPVDSKGLLNAVENGNYIGLMPEDNKAALKNAPVASKQGLVINPYPLKDNALHGNEQGGSVEQAMMEQGGMLRPALTPGKTQSIGMIERTRKSSMRQTQTIEEKPSSLGVATVDSVDVVSLAPLPPKAPEPLSPPKEQAQMQGSVFQDAVGFGKELPLALALSQIVPPEYSYAFGQSVNTGEIVSWEGGKPWNIVLDDMIAPKGLRAVISGNQVLIQARKS